MAYPVLITGKSGSGKSASLRNLNPADVAVINVLGKPLPFKSAGFRCYRTDDYDKVKAAISKTKAPIIVIDDAGYLITNSFMRGHAQSGAGNSLYTFYNTIGDRYWNFIEFISLLNTDQRVYVMMHEDTNDFGSVKPKTAGRKGVRRGHVYDVPAVHDRQRPARLPHAVGRQRCCKNANRHV